MYSCCTACWSFFGWFLHLFAELLSVPQLSHSLFRFSIALFSLHNAAAHQQGFPLSNSLRNVYLHTHNNMRRWSQSVRLMAIRCKCSAVCILRYCNTEHTESAEIWYQIHTVNNGHIPKNQWLNWCLGSVHCFTFRCEDGYNSFGTFDIWYHIWNRCWRSPFEHEQNHFLLRECLACISGNIFSVLHRINSFVVLF